MESFHAKKITFADKIKVTTINVNGYRTRESQVRKYISENGRNSILALSDTRLTKSIKVQEIPGYAMIRKDKISNTVMATAGGVLLIIPNRWSCLSINLVTTGDHFEAVAAIVLPTGRGCKPLKILCIYNHPGHHFPGNIITEFKNMTFNGREIPGFILGDLNCPNVAFGSRVSNEFGNKLLQLLNQENLILFNCKSPTYFSNASGLSNVLDLVIGEPLTSRFVESCQVRGDVGSDHLPVTTTLSFTDEIKEQERINMDVWAKYVDRELESYELSECIDTNIEYIGKVFMETRARCLTVKKPRKRNFPPEISRNLRLRKTILRNRKKASTDLARLILTKQYNRINRTVQEQIRIFDDEKLQNLATEICNSRNTNQMWGSFNRYKNRHKDIEEPDAPLVTSAGSFTTNNREKCDEFAHYLRSVHSVPENPLFDQVFKDKVDDSILKPETIPPAAGTNPIPKIGVKKFEELLNETKPGSSPGEDQISYDILKLCSSSTKQVMCNLFNQCLEKNVFPPAWKKAKLRMLPKPGRDKNYACNYRPISLLSGLGKIFERYIYPFLLAELDSMNFITKCQAGFLKGRSSQEHIFRLSQDVSNAFKKRECCLAVFLDVKAAFDSVWLNGLKYKISKIGLSEQMTKLLFSFLYDKTLKVYMDGVWSDIVNLRAGTPQGSCLSPILYIIYMNDMTHDLDLSKLMASQYADDTGLWVCSSKVSVAAKEMQKALTKLEQWCMKWRVTLSPAKSQLLLFTKCFRHKDEVQETGLDIHLFQEKILVAAEATFLGVIFDTRLTWQPQFSKLVSKAYTRLNLLRIISAQSNKHNPNMLATLYTSIIRTIFEYGSIGMINAAETHFDKLQLIQNQAMRIMMKSPAYTSVTDLHDCTGLPRIKQHLIDFVKMRVESMKRSSPIIWESINAFKNVQHISENSSVLDVIGHF